MYHILQLKHALNQPPCKEVFVSVVEVQKNRLALDHHDFCTLKSGQPLSENLILFYIKVISTEKCKKNILTISSSQTAEILTGKAVPEISLKQLKEAHGILLLHHTKNQEVVIVSNIKLCCIIKS